jgi:predicted neutral ceramidase superfamily lipid hydrolase
LGKTTAGLFFASFAIASFPGTVFNNIIGQIVIINKRIKDFVSRSSNLLLIFYIISVVSLILLNEILLKNYEFYNFFNITLISLLGTPFMLRALYFRHMFLSVSRSYQKKIFIRDIMYGVSISPIIVALYYIGGQDSLIYSYLISSFLALIYYQRVK